MSIVIIIILLGFIAMKMYNLTINDVLAFALLGTIVSGILLTIGVFFMLIFAK